MKKISTLVADDVLQMRQLLNTILRQLGCDVSVVEDGSLVMKAISDHNPDILFLDLEMPGMSGLEVLAQFETLSNPPFTVVITADNNTKTRSRALDYGVNGYITKPYSEQMISDVIRNFCARRDAPLHTTALIAEDDDLMRDLLINMLEKQHCRVIHSSRNGKDALAYLELEAIPNLVFLDIEMPVLDGLSTLREIREKKFEVFCAMISAHSSFENVKNAIDQGADGFIVKPYTDEKLRQVLAKYHAHKKTNSM